MGCGRNEESNDVRRHQDNCICEVVRAIKRVQDIREDRDCDDCRTDCFLTPLGSLVSPSRQRANTRVFMLLTDDGDPFKAMFKRERRRGRGSLGTTELERDCGGCFSVFFRVQNVFDNCCATLEVLEPRKENGERVNLFKHGKLDFDELCHVERFEATGSCITVDLKCFCGIQCVKDVFIDCDED
ncbi:CotY/CotZ family spore coat protein [Sporosarcina sp. JAI121]|uniref:CotY/CotZ family spore coat protein n=1 Tax=Sporosarcina sp. JAI121 TaxID=2723064 RepID=UPI0015CDB4C8|nr:CotY/CotZ family spore coat protein [Sporosarcina sp. JAI121]NYF24010.1 spore coat protein Z [Sporosarcina sp. JAI121]